MHTFFINTSGKELENYEGFFEVQHETRQLVSLECPILKWKDEDVGYEACVRKMGELIDSYKDITNTFNLILYIDLLPYKEYTSISMDSHLERYACLLAMRTMLKHYVNATLLKKLSDNGRVPQEVLIIFEENSMPKDKDDTTEKGKKRIRSYVKKFFGLEDADNQIANILDAIPEDQLDSTVFCNKVEQEFNSILGEKMLSTYPSSVEVFLNEIKAGKELPVALDNLFKLIMGYKKEDDRAIESVSFITNRRADIANKQANARRDLRLCFYLYSCVEDNTIYKTKIYDGESSSSVKQFPEIDWDKVAHQLNKRNAIYKFKSKEAARLKESFVDLELAPVLYALDIEKFGLDEFGKNDRAFEIIDAKQKIDKDQEDKDEKEAKIRAKSKKELVENEAPSRESLFDNIDYPVFDYDGDGKFSEQENLGPSTSAEEFVDEAIRLREHHLDYMHKLKEHVYNRLSNYAGRSSENAPALLAKRKVSLEDEIFDEEEKDYRYAAIDKNNQRKPEEKKLKAAEETSKMAYSTTLLNYMSFCAGRSVAVTDIEEHCNWFITRVNQIKESLKKIKYVAIGILFALIVLYVPFFLIQFEAIFDNTMTMTIAIMSFAIPLALLYTIFGIITAIQRKKYYTVWKEFKEKSDKVLADNRDSAEKYDQLLSVYIPSLRFIYEYKLDVEFYADCCRLARAKVEHHTKKLRDMLEIVGNIVEDLEIETEDNLEEMRGKAAIKIDYNLSFCSGENNKRFYSIIDNNFLKAVYLEGGEE